MAKRLRVGRSSVAAVVVGVVLAAGCGGSSDTKEKDGAAGGTGDGTAGSGGSNAGGGSKASGGKSGTGGKDGGGAGATGGSGQAGGSGAESGGSSPGGSGTATGGVGDASGGAADGGTGGSGAATGGTASQAGASPGTGGFVLPEPEVGTVGTECSEPGALSCAGTLQRVVVVCGANGTWEPLETCPVGQFCDTQPGPTHGSCQEPHPSCVDKSPGEVFCHANGLYACGPDTITLELAQDCDVYCADKQCRDAVACPVGDRWANCITECSGGQECLPAECNGLAASSSWPSIDAVRVLPGCRCGDMNQYSILRDLMGADGTYLKITVSPPWTVGVIEPDADPCELVSDAQCAIVERHERDMQDIVVMTHSAEATFRNVGVAYLTNAEDAVCP